jgi:hypothetical protein
MPAIQPAWHDPDTRRLMCLTFYDGWTWNDYESSHQQAYQMIREQSHSVAIILLTTTPESMKIAQGNGISVIRSLFQRLPKNVAGIYVVNASILAKSMGTIFGSVASFMGVQLRFVDTLEAAREVAEDRFKSITPQHE